VNGWSRLENQGTEFQDIETDPVKKKENLGRFQFEMQEFIAFAKKKFFEQESTGAVETEKKSDEKLPDVPEFRALLKDVLFSDSIVEDWRRPFADEQETPKEINFEADVDKYLAYIVEATDNPEKLEKFVDALKPYFDSIRKIGAYPALFRDLLSIYDGKMADGNGVLDSSRIFGDVEKFSTYVINGMIRAKEKTQDEPRRMKERLEKSPLADTDEVNAGIYREELEPQVSDAVFSLRKKGYSTFQSGLYNLDEGSQFIDFNKEDAEFIKKTLDNSSIKKLLQGEGVSIKTEESDDRLSLVLNPDNPRQDLVFWKKIWDTFVEAMPNRGFNATPPIELGSYKTFIERQNAIRSGKKTYVGYGLQYEDGKVTERSDI